MTSALLQKVRNFTVEIRSSAGDRMGTGVIVASDGTVATCAHVVANAGVNPRGDQPTPGFIEFYLGSICGRQSSRATQAHVLVRFPRAIEFPQRLRKAKLKAFLPKHDDDIVLLELIDSEELIILPQHVAVLGGASDSERHEFQSYGYRRLGKYPAARASGAIEGLVEIPSDRNAAAEPVQIRSSHIDRGMSGAPVLDRELNLVVGVIAETWFAEHDAKDRDTAWAIDASVLGQQVFGLPIHSQCPTTAATTRPAGVAPGAFRRAMPFDGSHAPQVPRTWVGRNEELSQMQAWMASRTSKILALIGRAGEGKSVLCRRWIDTVARGRRIFWYSFARDSTVDDFFDAALKYLAGPRFDSSELPTPEIRSKVLGAMLGSKLLFVLDDLHYQQWSDPERFGELRSKALRDFLECCTSAKHPSRCVITSRVPLTELLSFSAYSELRIPSLSDHEARELLYLLGINNAALMGPILEACDGNALALSLQGQLASLKDDG